MLSGLLFLLRTACLPVLSLLPLLLLKLGKHALIVAVSCSTHFLPSCSGSHRLAAQGAAAQGLPPQRQVALPDHLCEWMAAGQLGWLGAMDSMVLGGAALKFSQDSAGVAWFMHASFARQFTGCSSTCTLSSIKVHCPPLFPPARAATHRPGDCQGHGLHPRV